MGELNTKSIAQLAPLLRDKQISPFELTEATLAQTDYLNDSLNAYIDIYREEAITAAKMAEEEILQGKYRGPLHGIPIALKDNIYVKGKVTTMGSKIHQDFKPHFDATVVNRLREAGAILTGKLNMHEYALGITTDNPHYGPCRNPWNANKTPGGSSGGSGAAVAAHMATASIGTDTGGSIRIPASACGIVGLKPTFGRVSKYGCFAEAWTLDHVGPMTKTVDDTAILLQALEGFDENDPTSVKVPKAYRLNAYAQDVRQMVIGINESYYFNDIDNDVDLLVRKRIKMLEDMGAKIEAVDIPSLQYCEYALTITDMSEASTVHHHHLKSRPQDFGEDVRPILELGEVPTAVEYLQAQQIRRKLKLEFEKAFTKIDVLIAPTLPIIPPEIGRDVALLNGEKVDLFDNVLRLTSPANFTGLPSLSVPAGLADGMPVGIQLIGDTFEERKILRVGNIIESMNPLEGKTPDLDSLNNTTN